MGNITKTFETWEEFLDYVTELKDFLYDNDYIYNGREKVMQDEETFLEDLKAKGFYEKYLEFWWNCKKYIDDNIVVYNYYQNKRYKEFDYSFRFSYQPWANKYTINSYRYEKESVFVWDLINYREAIPISPAYLYAYSVVNPIVFSLPVNKKFWELGCCWFSKNDYSVEDVKNKCIEEYTTQESLQKFIQEICTTFSTKEGLPKLACVDIETKRDDSNCPGPKSSWEVGIGGFKLERMQDHYKVTIGLETKTNIMVSTFYDAVDFKNQEPQMATNELLIKVTNAIKTYLNVDENQVKTITWYNKKEKTHIINNDGNVSIYCYNSELDKEFKSLKGNLIATHPYDHEYWGWT